MLIEIPKITTELSDTLLSIYTLILVVNCTALLTHYWHRNQYFEQPAIDSLQGSN